jgi:hypothetical protein
MELQEYSFTTNHRKKAPTHVPNILSKMADKQFAYLGRGADLLQFTDTQGAEVSFKWNQPSGQIGEQAWYAYINGTQISCNRPLEGLRRNGSSGT